MDLQAYMTQYDLRPADFAELLEVSTTHVYDLLSGRRQPSLVLAVQIEEVTDGLVTPKDLVRVR